MPLESKFLDAGIQNVSTSISIVHDLIERYPDDDDGGEESDKHIKARDRRYSCLNTQTAVEQKTDRIDVFMMYRYQNS